MYFTGRKTWVSAALLALAMLAGCSTTSTSPAPVEDRGTTAAPRVDPATLPGAENAGKPGYYVVRPGDTLTTTWTVVAKDDKPAHGGGIVAFRAVATNQQGETVAQGSAKMLAHATAVWLAARRG